MKWSSSCAYFNDLRLLLDFKALARALAPSIPTVFPRRLKNIVENELSSMTDEIGCLPGLKTTICNELLCAQCSAEIKCKWESQRAHTPERFFCFLSEYLSNTFLSIADMYSSLLLVFFFLAQRCSVGGNCILIVSFVASKKKLIILLVKFLKGYDKPIKKILR